MTFVTEKEAAATLHVHPGTLRNWRSAGRGGPAFYKIGGKVLYRRVDVARFLAGSRR
ncbi:helix-turn-helix domain-containing protein [Phycicoccus sp. Root563]|uniref:helix-turn-helix domain-containing protein n=1 Tax=Phycicoccus sp. Root563 TaxID=1736562 RepID=UPI0009EB749C|nr:helix-turn-helix domain-containing protein [Phycicoccus sp. Root563]